MKKRTNPAVTYLITFACYGSHLHGDASGSVDRAHNLPRSPVLEPDSQRIKIESRQMNQPPYVMDRTRRDLVLASLIARCHDRHWTLLAAHVRTNHVHIVVDAEADPERVMNDIKSYASRCHNQAHLDERSRKRWTRHGSTRWLGNPEHIAAAIRYVVAEQGDAMAVFEASA